ncbi:MAG: RNA polymerase sigma factor [Gemmatimonadetes bacterium]|nr:RNA polymerase sigma factor [Gemmatimonadota bacterium]
MDARHVDVEQQLEELHEDSFGWALSCCGHHEADAEDVLQMTYARVISGRAVFKGKSSFRTWLFGVIRMVALEQRRRRQRRSRLDARAVGHLELVSEPEAPKRIERSDLTRRLLRALADLPERQREVLHLVFYDGLTVGEAAQVMGIGVGSARTHYARGKDRLRVLLGEADG